MCLCILFCYLLHITWHLGWSVLDHGIAPAFLRNSSKKLMILCCKTPCLMKLGIFTNEMYSNWMFSGIQAHQRLGSIYFMPISTRAILFRKIGNHSCLILDVNLNRISKTQQGYLSYLGATVPQHDYIKKHFKSRNPVFNIPWRNEPVATDTVFSDTPAINHGSTMAQFFV